MVTGQLHLPKKIRIYMARAAPEGVTRISPKNNWLRLNLRHEGTK